METMQLLAGHWLPIVVSSVVVFMASFLAWMVLPHHKPEWQRVEKEVDFQKAIRDFGLAPGQYMFPHTHDMEEMKSEEFQQRAREGPNGSVTVWSGAPNMGQNIGLTFSFFVVTSIFIAYLATIALPADAGFMQVFRFVATAGVMTYCFGLVQGAIWFKRRILMDFIDGVAYALLTAIIFGLLW